MAGRPGGEDSPLLPRAAPLPCTHSRTSFLSSILAITSRSSLAFSSLHRRDTVVVGSLCPKTHQAHLSWTGAGPYHPPVQRRGFMRSHGYQFGKDVRARNSWVRGVHW